MNNKRDGIEKALDDLKRVSSWKKLVASPKGGPPWGNWNHQYEAYRFAREYLEYKKVDRSKAALIRMPTGTGKTGVMALIANYSSGTGHILIVVPSHFLISQIIDGLNWNFWFRIGCRPDHAIRPAMAISRGELNSILNKDPKEPSVLVCTHYTLTRLFRSASKNGGGRHNGEHPEFKMLQDAIDMVLVDEGHREPAREWSRAIRELAKPTILFSATPYRNDLRMFRVGRGDQHRFVFKYQDAKKAGIIREISFVPDVSGYAEDPRGFAEMLHRFYYGGFQKLIPRDVRTPKVIVRCDNTNHIGQITEALRELEDMKRHKGDGAERVIAVHDYYGEPGHRGSGYFGEAPPDRGVVSKAVFWVHQHKLAEGLDDPEFCMVAFYEPFGNARALVQQLGRITRNPSGDRKARAWVFSDPAFGLEEQWQGYLSYEKYEKSIIGSEDIILAFRESLPDWFYYSKNFRQCATFEDKDLVLEDVRLRPTVRVYVPPYRIDEEVLGHLATRVSEELEEQNMIQAFSHTWTDDEQQTINSLLVHWRIEQTPYLERTGFFETSLFPTFLSFRKPYLFYHGCASLTTVDERNSYYPVAQRELEHLIPQHVDNSLKQITASNMDLGTETVRKRSIGGLALDKVGQMLNDHTHVLNSVLAIRNKVPIYLGFSRGTVSEPTKDMLSIAEFNDWTEQIRAELKNQGVDVNHGILRYARPVRAPHHAKGRYLLLDLTSFLREYDPTYAVAVPYREEFVAEACDIKPDRSFNIQILGEKVSGKLDYYAKRFHVRFDPINPAVEQEAFEAVDPRNKSRPESFLSQGASIQVVTEDGLVYADGQFFDPGNLWGPNRVRELDIFAGSRFMDHITKGEKGKWNEKLRLVEIEGDTWATGSIFRGTDDASFYTQLGLTPDVLICEDLGDERADFLAFDFNDGKIAQVHCKNCGDTMGELSAGKLHEVISQVQKNLGFFEPSARIDPGLVGKWRGNWDDRLPRLRRHPEGWTFDQTIRKVRDLMRSTNVQKEVWVVMGNACSPTKLPAAVKGTTLPRHSIIQMLYLLHVCVSSVHMVGAQLKVVTGTVKESELPAKPKAKQSKPQAEPAS